MTLQYIIIALVVLVCLGIVARRIYRTFTDSSSACEGCQLKDACTRHGRKHIHRPSDCGHKPGA